MWFRVAQKIWGDWNSCFLLGTLTRQCLNEFELESRFNWKPMFGEEISNLRLSKDGEECCQQISEACSAHTENVIEYHFCFTEYFI